MNPVFPDCLRFESQLTNTLKLGAIWQTSILVTVMATGIIHLLLATN